MQLFYNYYHNRVYNFFNSDIVLFESSVWLHTFSRALIAIFIPILLLQIGYSIGEVVLYYFLYNVFDVPLNFWAHSVTARIGAKRTIILGSLFSIGYFVVLFNLTANSWPFLIAMAMFAALYDTLYWVAHLFIFYKYNKKEAGHAAENTSTLSIVRSVAGIAAPIIGAGILIYIGKEALIVTSLIVLVLSIWLLFQIRTIKDVPEVRRPSFREFFAEEGVFKKYLSKSFASFHTSSEGIIWPMFIFLVFDSITSVAYLPIIASITTIMLTYYTGKLAQKNKKVLVMVGGIALSLIWILRMFIEAEPFYYISVFLIGLFSVLITLPIDSSFTELVKKKDPLSVSTYRNFFSMAGNIFFYGILALLINVFQVSFILAASSCLAVVFVMGSINRRCL